MARGNLKESLVGVSKKPHTEQSKKMISDSIRRFYKNNPERHNWKSCSKLVSAPCEEFKSILDDNGIEYVSEFTPLEGRFFSIDIAFPEKRIGIEINGNQHYNKDGSLKEYYENRHRLIEESGWKLYEIHFSVCYKRDEVLGIMSRINERHEDIFSFDYDGYLVNKMCGKINLCKKCGRVKLSKYSKKCISCSGFSQRKVKRPEYAQLLIDIGDVGYVGAGRKYGVSDNAIRKWMKAYEKEKGKD